MENKDNKAEVINLVDWLSKSDNLKKLSNDTFFHTNRLMAQAILAKYAVNDLDRPLSFKDFLKEKLT